MVLRAIITSLVVAGCGQSLFDNNVGPGTNTDGGGGGTGDGGNVASSCPQGCIGDAAGDIDGGRPGWRYLEDTRNRSWMEMAGSGESYTGAVSGNAITTCAASSSSAACAALPGALLVSTAGATTTADPAVEFTVSSAQVIQLSARVHVPSGQPDQQVRLYRNSREDSLVTAMAVAGATYEVAVTADALPGDRFLLAIAPQANGATDVGVQLYINTTGEVFPKACQLAVSFTEATGFDVPNACGAAFNHRRWDDTASESFEVVPDLTAGPFAELGTAADIPTPRYYLGADTLVRTGDTTTQLWMRVDAVDPTYAGTAFSDLDLDTYGGLQIGVFENSGTKIEAATCTSITNNTINCSYAVAPYTMTGWHFVRVVHAGDQVRMCIDGVRVGSYPLPVGEMQSTYAPRMGRNVVWTPTGAFFDGAIDDVRVFSGALPCN